MKAFLANLLASKPSVEMVGWGTSLAVHVIGAAVAMVCTISGPVERAELLGISGSVELAGSWAEPPTPPVEILPTLPDEIVPIAQTLVEPDAISAIQRQHPPLDNSQCDPPVKLAMVGDPVPRPAPVLPSRRDVAPVLEPCEAAVSPPAAPRRTMVPSLPHVSAPAQEQPASAAATGAVDVLPRKLPRNPAPPYPPDAFAQRQEGRVLLQVHIDQRGQVEEISVAQSSGVPCLDRAALETVRKWRFEPARHGGKAVATVVIVPIRFSIEHQ